MWTAPFGNLSHLSVSLFLVRQRCASFTWDGGTKACFLKDNVANVGPCNHPPCTSGTSGHAPNPHPNPGPSPSPRSQYIPILTLPTAHSTPTNPSRVDRLVPPGCTPSLSSIRLVRSHPPPYMHPRTHAPTHPRTHAPTHPLRPPHNDRMSTDTPAVSQATHNGIRSATLRSRTTPG